MTPNFPPLSPWQNAGRLLLGGALAFAGVSHLTFARDEFQAQVPKSLPLNEDFVVLASGVAEISLGAALVALLGGRAFALVRRVQEKESPA